MRKNNREPMSKRSDIASPATSGKSGPSVFGPDAGRVQVTVTVHLSRAHKAQSDPAGLKQAHDLEQASGAGGSRNVGRIAHRVQELGRGFGPDEAVLEKPHRRRRMSLLGQQKR